MSETCPKCGSERASQRQEWWLCDSVVSLGAFIQSDQCRLRQIDVLESALAAATKRAEEAEAKLAEARFQPLGDNHHNAAMCPYCQPTRQDELGRLAAAEQENARLRQGIAWLECDIRTADLAQLSEECDEWEAFAAALLTQPTKEPDHA